MAYAAEAGRLAEANAEQYERAMKERREKVAAESHRSSESRSTINE